MKLEVVRSFLWIVVTFFARYCDRFSPRRFSPFKEDPRSVRPDSRHSTCSGIPDTFLRIRTRKVVAT
jgi:hypothetical protein